MSHAQEQAAEKPDMPVEKLQPGTMARRGSAGRSFARAVRAS